MKIGEIYDKYQIMPQLSLHMRRVASVGQLIMDGWRETIDRDLVIRTLLLHDMGNIVKFDLTKPIMPIENIEDWQKVQREWWDKYGRDTHQVTKTVVAELGQTDVVEVFTQEHVGYLSGDTGQILKQDWPAKLLAYADTRVTPKGVVPMKERIADLQRRYGRELPWYDFLYRLEEQVKTMTETNLTGITDAAIQPTMKDWLEYEIITP